MISAPDLAAVGSGGLVGFTLGMSARQASHLHPRITLSADTKLASSRTSEIEYHLRNIDPIAYARPGFNNVIQRAVPLIIRVG
jgi:hypothetical protein